MIVTLAICGALLACGMSMSIFYDEEYFRHFFLQVVGFTMAGAAVGALFGLIGTAVTADNCPEGQVEVIPGDNAAGALGCVPYELLPEIAK